MKSTKDNVQSTNQKGVSDTFDKTMDMERGQA